MIQSKKDYREYLETEYQLYFPKGKTEFIKGFLMRSKFYRIWRFLKNLRKAEYYKNCENTGWGKVKFAWYHRKKNILGSKLGFEVAENSFDKGVLIYHIAPLIINEDARIGKNSRISGNLCIGNTGPGTGSPCIGEGVEFGWGSCVIGHIHIADKVKIGAGAVVTKDIQQTGECVAGVPARNLSGRKR